MFFVYVVTLLPLLFILRKYLANRRLPAVDLPPPLVSTLNGKVSGSWERSPAGKRIFASFKGIPYAKPPLGKLRFMRPEPVEDWSGVKTCTKVPEFIQRNIFLRGQPSAGSEDALILNVFSPNLQGDLPVMVFIHGGGFVSGSSSTKFYGGDFFMEKDVVLVSINYRLSVLGGLYLDGENVPGNQGMRDQVLALRWVQNNIKLFGGNPDKVTIFGESAGAMSVMNHVLSPMSAGLFSAAIAQSGSPISPYVCLNKHPAHYGHKLLEAFGIDTALPISDILTKLQNIDAIALQDKAYMFEEFIRAPAPFKPIVDGGLVEDPFLPEEPRELIRKGKYNKVPLIMGHNRDEGLLVEAFYKRIAGSYDTAWNNFDTVGPLAFFATEKDEVTKEESAVCKSYLNKNFKNTKFSPEGPGFKALVKMYGDLLFAAPADHACQLMGEQQPEQPIYQYRYEFQGAISLYDVMTLPPWKLGLRILFLAFGLDLFSPRAGVCHADELFLLFKANVIPFSKISSEEKKAQKNLIDMWTDFARCHDPTPETKVWKQYDRENPKFLRISSSCKMDFPAEFAATTEEWKDIWTKVPTYHRIARSPTWEKYPVAKIAEE